ncbi:hypothetical protein TWF718_000340 [Orbilia javanica]|uniref:Uncharacterized protein n=1 Tax=Orbilia javanica TaxID=47235 RepID=A0AAN8RFT0_9PEZI
MTDTQKKEEWEGPPLDQEEEDSAENTHPAESVSAAGEEDSAATAQNHDSRDSNEESTSQTPGLEKKKDKVGEDSSQGEKKEKEKGLAQNTGDQSEWSSAVRGRSRSRSTRRLASRPSKVGNDKKDDGNVSTTAVSSPDKSQSLPSVYEDKESTNKGQLVKRNRRRNKRSGYESSATEELPLRERQYPPQKQAQIQQQPEAGKKSDPIKLRLDLNLEVEVELKARIHGDLTLSLF